MSERRKSRRWHLVFYLQVRDRASSRPLGHLADISSGGIALLTKHELTPGQDYDLRLELPEEIESARSLDFSAKALWCKKDINPDYFVTGFRFLNLQKGDSEIIDELVQALKFDA